MRSGARRGGTASGAPAGCGGALPHRSAGRTVCPESGCELARPYPEVRDGGREREGSTTCRRAGSVSRVVTVSSARRAPPRETSRAVKPERFGTSGSAPAASRRSTSWGWPAGAGLTCEGGTVAGHLRGQRHAARCCRWRGSPLRGCGGAAPSPPPRGPGAVEGGPVYWSKNYMEGGRKVISAVFVYLTAHVEMAFGLPLLVQLYAWK